MSCFVLSIIILLLLYIFFFFFFFSSRRRHTRLVSDWSSDVCSSDLGSPVSRLSYKADTGRAKHRHVRSYAMKMIWRRWRLWPGVSPWLSARPQCGIPAGTTPSNAGLDPVFQPWAVLRG